MNKTKDTYNKILFTKEQEMQIINMYTKQNFSTVKIGKVFGCGHKTIARVLEEHHIPRTGVGRRKYLVNETYFDKIDTPNKAYCLGFLYADGSNSISKSTITMSLQEDDFQILENIRLEIGSEKPLEFLDYSNKHDFGYTYKNQYRLNIFSKHMCNSLQSIGMLPNKSLILTYPDIPDNLHSHFIRGYFDGDGSVCQIIKSANNHAVQLTITSTETFCQKLCEICKDKIGITGHIYNASCNNGITKVFNLSGRNLVKTFLDWIYTDAELYMERKHERYINYYT